MNLERSACDILDRPVREIGPDGQPLTIRYDYDALGRLQHRHLPATGAPATSRSAHCRNWPG